MAMSINVYILVPDSAWIKAMNVEGIYFGFKVTVAVILCDFLPVKVPRSLNS